MSQDEIVFRKSPARPIAASLACFIFAMAAAIAARQESSAARAVLLACFVLGGLYFAVMGLAVARDRSDTLRLDPLGFSFRDHGLERRVYWRDVASAFRPLRLFHQTVIAWTTDGSDPPKGFYGYLSRAAQGTVDIMPGDYHWSPYILARHMNRARARAIAEGRVSG
jgi:hypothetical protein